MYTSKDIESQMLPSKHVGSLLLLMFVSTFRPSAIWPSFTFSLEPIAVLLVGFLFIYKVFTTVGFKSFFNQYKLELLLLCLYFLTCLLSLYLNRSRYQDPQEIVRYGITFVSITACFPLVLFMFSLPQNSRGFSLSNYLAVRQINVGLFPLILVFFISILAISQLFLPKLYYAINQFFIASEISGVASVRSIFRISTDFASISAIIGSFLLVFVLVNHKKLSFGLKSLIFSVAALCLLSGIVSGKRVFILTVLLILVLSVYLFLRRDFKTLLISAVIIIVGFHLIVVFGPHMLGKRMGIIFPYISYLVQFELPPLESFVINLNSGAFENRARIFGLAWSMFTQDPLLGVSNGGFRFVNRAIEQNTHNFVLQILIEAGVVGATIVLLLIGQFIRRASEKVVALVAMMFLLGSMSVDYFIDHSVPWVVIVGYFSVWYWRFCLKFEVKGIKE